MIDRKTWPRREHFRLYNKLAFPHVNICAPLDITELWAHRDRIASPPTVALVYIVMRAAHRVPELRQRLRGEEVVEHEIIHPSVTVLGEDDLFGVVTLTYQERFGAFAADAAGTLTQAKEATSLDEFPHDPDDPQTRDDLLSITILPWLAFTSFSITRRPTETIPLVAFGKVHKAEGRYQLPFFVNFHHALADGLHVARFTKFVEDEARALASLCE